MRLRPRPLVETVRKTFESIASLGPDWRAARWDLRRFARDSEPNEFEKAAEQGQPVRAVKQPGGRRVQDHPVGELVDVSVNETGDPAAGDAGENVKPAPGAAPGAAVP